MWSLITKDFVSTAKSMGLMLLLYVIFSFVSSFPADTYLIMGIFTFATQATYLEEKNNTLLLMKTMPLKTSTIVISKYLATLLVAVLYGIVGFVDIVFIRGMGAALLMDMLFGIFVMLAMMGLFLASFFKSGYSKSSQVFIFLFMILFAAMMIPNYMPDLLKVLEPVSWIFSFATWSPFQTLGLGVVILGFYALTAYFAINYLKKRENF